MVVRRLRHPAAEFQNHQDFVLTAPVRYTRVIHDTDLTRNFAPLEQKIHASESISSSANGSYDEADWPSSPGGCQSDYTDSSVWCVCAPAEREEPLIWEYDPVFIGNGDCAEGELFYLSEPASGHRGHRLSLPTSYRSDTDPHRRMAAAEALVL